jgi:hypothetical protein
MRQISARERRHRAASAPVTDIEFQCPTCYRLCRSRLGLQSLSRVHGKEHKPRRSWNRMTTINIRDRLWQWWVRTLHTNCPMIASWRHSLNGSRRARARTNGAVSPGDFTHGKNKYRDTIKLFVSCCYVNAFMPNCKNVTVEQLGVFLWFGIKATRIKTFVPPLTLEHGILVQCY